MMRNEAASLFLRGDLLALGLQADAERARVHPEGFVTYSVGEEQNSPDFFFRTGESAAQLTKRLDDLGNAVVLKPVPDSNVTAVEYLSVLALTRLVRPDILNLQVVWETVGLKVGQIALRFGANDFGNLENEPSAGISEETLRQVIRDAGFVPKKRGANFETLAID